MYKDDGSGEEGAGKGSSSKFINQEMIPMQNNDGLTVFEEILVEAIEG